MGRIDYESETMIAHSLRGEGFDASKYGTGRGTPLVPVAIQERAVSTNPDNGPHGAGWRDDGAAYTLEARNKVQAVAFAHQAAGTQTMLGYADDGTCQTLGAHQTPAVAFAQNQRGELRTSDVSLQLTTGGGKPGEGYPAVMPPYAVRKLTPTECERLQGFPDGWTAIPYRGKPADACPDGPRYKALGNSWAVNCGQYVFDGIRRVDAMIREGAA